MSQYIDIEALNQQIGIESRFVDALLGNQSKIIVGQRHMMSRLLIGLLTRGHILLEGLPGLAKTLAIFAHFVLADEINRAPAKVQSALLEAMQERQVTIGKETYPLEEPFLVLATQNPIEQEGTYPLPEAQVDRFMMKVVIKYPSLEEEREIFRRNMNDEISKGVEQVITIPEILRAREAVKKIYIDERIENYILNIVFASRNPERYKLNDLQNLITYGASPRATIFLGQAARANAFLNHRGFVIPDDVQQVAKDVLRHRIGLSYEAEAENINTEDIISSLLSKVEVP